jgi:hypothetical protein
MQCLYRSRLDLLVVSLTAWFWTFSISFKFDSVIVFSFSLSYCRIGSMYVLNVAFRRYLAQSHLLCVSHFNVVSHCHAFLLITLMFFLKDSFCGRIILKCMLEKYGVKVWNGSSVSG